MINHQPSHLINHLTYFQEFEVGEEGDGGEEVARHI